MCTLVYGGLTRQSPCWDIFHMPPVSYKMGPRIYEDVSSRAVSSQQAFGRKSSVGQGASAKYCPDSFYFILAFLDLQLFWGKSAKQRGLCIWCALNLLLDTASLFLWRASCSFFILKWFGYWALQLSGTRVIDAATYWLNILEQSRVQLPSWARRHKLKLNALIFSFRSKMRSTATVVVMIEV